MITLSIAGDEYFYRGEWEGPDAAIRWVLTMLSDTITVTPDMGDPVYVIGHQVAEMLGARVISYEPPPEVPGRVY